MSRYTGEKGKVWEEVKKWTRRVSNDCYTCGAKDIETYNAQAGHYLPVAVVGLNNQRAWDERFIRLQCGRCNGAGQGEQVWFRAKLVEELGEEAVVEFDRAVRAKETKPVKDWKALREHFKWLDHEKEKLN